MAEPHNLTYDQQQHVESHAPYGTVFYVLLNFTAMEYVYASAHQSRWLPLLLGGTAVVLTVLTAIMALVFHLHFNRYWVYLTLIPAVILSFLPVPLILGLMVLAISKATLVGMYFMHLKFEGNWVFLMLIPAAILAAVLMFGLVPDIAMQPGPPPSGADDELAAAPFEPRPALRPVA